MRSATARASWMSWPAQQAPLRWVARAVVVELQRDADHVVAGLGQQRRGDRGIDAARHGDDDARVGRPSFDIEAVQHGDAAVPCGRGVGCISADSRLAITIGAGRRSATVAAAGGDRGRRRGGKFCRASAEAAAPDAGDMHLRH